MTKPQTEAELEAVLLSRLDNLGYDRVAIPDERALLANLKRQLEKHNKVQLSESEFDKVLNHLDKGNVFDRAKTLRDKYHLTRDDGSSLYLQFLEMEHWCQNEYQVTQQVAIEGSYKNRYDVTLLINGLPLVQIELKRRGLELKEAFSRWFVTTTDRSKRQRNLPSLWGTQLKRSSFYYSDLSIARKFNVTIKEVMTKIETYSLQGGNNLSEEQQEEISSSIMNNNISEQECNVLKQWLTINQNQLNKLL